MPFSVIVSIVLLGGCAALQQDQGQCDEGRLPTTALPEPAGFSIVKTKAVQPQACGSDWKLHGVLAAASDIDDPLAAFAAEMLDQGWHEVPCVTKRERCFETEEWFVAATTPRHAPRYYPSPVGEGPQVLISLGEAVDR